MIFLRSRSSVVRIAAAAVALVPFGARGQTPYVDAPYSSSVSIGLANANAGYVTQMAWGPDGRLYASRSGGGAVSFSYDAKTGTLGDMQSASSINGLGIGFGPGATPGQSAMYLTSFDSIWRLTGTSGSTQWGTGPGQSQAAIVTGIPDGDHNVDQIQITGNTLYVGIGTRTTDGGTGAFTGGSIDDFGGKGMSYGGQGNTLGESAYGGTISEIKDLTKVATATGAANVSGSFAGAALQTNDAPYTSTADNQLVVHSAGARNPYGLALDQSGQLYFTNNYNRADSHGNGTSSDSGYADAPGANLALSVHDQLFKAVQGGDYGFRNDNWRGVTDPSVKAAILDPSNPDHIAVRSITPDSLYSTDPSYGKTYDPSHPVGLGPSSSSDGLAFWYNANLPSGLAGDAFITQYTSSITASAPGGGSITYADLIAADPNTGAVTRVAEGFVDPLATIVTPDGRLLVADFGSGMIWELSASAVPEPSALWLFFAASPFAAYRLCRRR